MLPAEHGYESQHLPHILLENVGKQQKSEIYIFLVKLGERYIPRYM